MTETNLPPNADASPTPPVASRGLTPWLGAAGFLILAAAVAHLWYQPPIGPDLASFEERLDAVEARITALEQRPPAGEPRPAAIPDLSQLTARLDTLEHRPAPDWAALLARLDMLEQQRSTVDVSGLTARLASVEKAALRGAQLARLQAAASALAAGQKLGDILGAPPALARFADKAPPTEAALRLRYPAAERAALDAAQPDQDNRPILDRMLARAGTLVTIRQGDKVLMGDPASGVLARARTALEAGDLNGAIAAVSALHGASAEAMASWLTDATALRDARQALADLADSR